MSARVRWLALVSVLTATLMARMVSAQSAALGQPASPNGARARVLVMADDERGRGEFAQRVDRAVQRALRELGFGVNPSTLPFRDAQLAAGCAGTVRDCGAPVAAALESEELLVSRIEDDPSLRYATLSLLRFAPRAAARAGTAQLPREPAHELQQSVFALVASMFREGAAAPSSFAAPPGEQPPAISEPVIAASNPAPVPAADSDYVQRIARAEHRRRLLAIGWPTLTVGAGLLVGGVVANLGARRESRAYDDLTPSSRQEVDAKLAHYNSAEDKTRAARVLWGVGGGLAAAGAFVLLWERFGPAPDRKLQSTQKSESHAANGRGARALRFGAAPTLGGFALSCAGEL